MEKNVQISKVIKWYGEAYPTCFKNRWKKNRQNFLFSIMSCLMYHCIPRSCLIYVLVYFLLPFCFVPKDLHNYLIHCTQTLSRGNPQKGGGGRIQCMEKLIFFASKNPRVKGCIRWNTESMKCKNQIRFIQYQINLPRHWLGMDCSDPLWTCSQMWPGFREHASCDR